MVFPVNHLAGTSKTGSENLNNLYELPTYNITHIFYSPGPTWDGHKK